MHTNFQNHSYKTTPTITTQYYSWELGTYIYSNLKKTPWLYVCSSCIDFNYRSSVVSMAHGFANCC